MFKCGDAKQGKHHETQSKETAMSIQTLSRTHRPQVSVLARVLQLAAFSRSRAGLANLDDHLLRDIGLTREEALAERARPLWDAPPHWKG